MPAVFHKSSKVALKRQQHGQLGDETPLPASRLTPSTLRAFGGDCFGHDDAAAGEWTNVGSRLEPSWVSAVLAFLLPVRRTPSDGQCQQSLGHRGIGGARHFAFATSKATVSFRRIAVARVTSGTGKGLPCTVT